ncbi:MAG: DoxX family protein [Bdellovibrionales bacterium]|nr:DoxX family protein [Bdellovibrionales bacterium]
MIKKLLCKTTPESSLFNEATLTILRVVTGLLMAGLHGSGKVPPSEGLIEGVGALGFPYPAVFAWLAGLAELVGGIFLVFGFLTRPSALLIAFTMLVAAFGKHAVDPWQVKELALLYMAIALVFTTKGSGRFSVDHFIK